jgi:tetratricopeptide (TPR) repeat protein
VNVLLHAAASFLVFLWPSRLPLTRWVAGAAAILWALHPVRAEVVANITARYESLGAVLGLSFLIACRSRRRVLAGALFLLTMWCKESAIALLPLAVLADALFPVEGRRFDPRAWTFPCALLLLWFFLRARAIASEVVPVPYVENPAAAVGLLDRIRTAGAVQLLYLRDQVLPLWLSTDHSYAQIQAVTNPVDPRWLGFLAILALSAILAWRSLRERPEILFCVLGYAILFAPGSNFILTIGTIMSDRLAYLPSIFTCLLAASVLVRISSRRMASVVVLVVAVLLSIASVRQAGVWRDSLTLFREQARTAPESAKSRGNYGEALRLADRFREAVVEYRKSIEIYPKRPDPHFGLAQAYESLNEDPELLIDTWADAIRYGTIGERSVRVRLLAFADLGRWKDVARIRAEVAAGDPDHPLLFRLDHLLRAANRLVSAPNPDDAWSRAQELFRRGEWKAADDAYRRALHLRQIPEEELRRSILDLAQCRENLGEPQQANWYRNLAAATDDLQK